MAHAQSPHTLRRIAVEAGADPRTVQRYLDGDPDRPVTSTAAGRIAAAIDRLGLNLRPATPATPTDGPIQAVH